MEAPSISLGIVTRNRAETLPRALASALRQRVHNLNVVVLDDGSTDQTPALAQQFPQVAWIRHEQRAGLIARRNELMTRDEFDYFVSLDDDAWFLRDDEIAKAVSFLEENRTVAAVAFDILSPDRPGSREWGVPQPAAPFVGCGHVLRISAVRKVGAYEIGPGTYGAEEKDLCLRLIDAGYEIVRLPGVHVWHNKASAARDAADQYRSCVCNDLVVTFRRTPTALLPIAFVLKCFQHFSSALRGGLLRPCLEAFRFFFCHLTETNRSRQPVKFSTLRAYMRLARKP